MLEKLKNSKENKNLSIESQANYEGNHTLLFFERMANARVRSKLINDLVEHKIGQRRIELEESKDYLENIRGELEFIIEKEIEEKIQTAKSHTNIKYADPAKPEIAGTTSEGVGLIFLHSILPDNNKKFTSKMNGIIEAHEKGHEIRWFGFVDTNFSKKISEGFDFSKVEIMNSTIEAAKRYAPERTEEELKDMIILYQENVNELYERMSQLKNYFGMRGDEVFTKEHLDYAKNNYLKDTGMGSQMKYFLDAITPQTEVKFIDLMNSLGV